MSNDKSLRSKYEPRCPKIYRLIFEAYAGLMSSTDSREIHDWGVKLCTLTETIAALKKDGGLTSDSSQKVQIDLLNLVREVEIPHAGITTLTHEQAYALQQVPYLVMLLSERA